MASKVLVVGSGAIGLRTALELLRQNVGVVLRSAHHPLNPKTCSMGSGGLWMPYKCNDKRVDKWAKDTLDELLHFSSSSGAHEKSESKSKSKSLVEIVPTLFLMNSNRGPKVDDFKNFQGSDYSAERGNVKSPSPEWTKDSRLEFQHLAIEMLEWQNQVLKLKIPRIDVMKQAGYNFAWLYKAPIVDPPRMLMNMLDEIQAHPLTVDVNVEMDPYQSVEEMVKDANENGCDGLVNCTGFGSAKLCKDEALIGGRGILLHYERGCARTIGDAGMVNDAAVLTEDGPWGTPADPVYIIPRGDVFVVGGTCYEGNTDTDLSEKERKRLMENAALMGIDTSASAPVNEWAGFRPLRETVRMEIDQELSSASGVRVLHSYGHGGSGWTTFVGVAKDATKLLLNC
jgi:D-amino-acid oxidase